MGYGEICSFHVNIVFYDLARPTGRCAIPFGGGFRRIVLIIGGIMIVNIETKRMLLKCVDQSDREFIFEEFQNDFINKYLFDAELMTNIEQADDLIEFYNLKEPRNQDRWVLINKLENIKMGTCGFHLWDRKRIKLKSVLSLCNSITEKDIWQTP